MFKKALFVPLWEVAFSDSKIQNPKHFEFTIYFLLWFQ